MQVPLSPNRKASFMAWRSHTFNAYQRYHDHHRVYGKVVLPAAAYVVAAIAAYQRLDRRSTYVLEGFSFHRVMYVHETDEPQLQVIYDPPRRVLDIYSESDRESDAAESYASGKIDINDDVLPTRIDLMSILARCKARIDIDTAYTMLRHCNLQYGPYYQCIRRLQRRDGESLATIEQHVAVDNPDAFPVHPTTLDACFQSLIATVDIKSVRQNGNPFLPVRIRRIRYLSSPGKRFYCHTIVTAQNRRMIVSDLRLIDSSGKTLVEVEGLCCLRAHRNVFA